MLNTSYRLRSSKTSHGFEEHWTVGIGHHNADVLPGDNVMPVYSETNSKKITNGHSYDEASLRAFFDKDKKRFENDINKIWTSDMTQNMFDAMFSFAYNHGNISKTQLGKTIKKDWKNQSLVRSVWMSSYVSGPYAKGLTKRRKAEVDYFYADSGLTNNESYDPGNSASSNILSQNPSANVLSDSNSNAYTNLTTIDGNQVSDANEHTRIYKMTDPTIQLDELSIPVGTFAESEKKDTNNNENEQLPDETKSDSLAGNNTSVGLAYPLIRIADHYFAQREIEYFSIESKGFLPTMKLIIHSNNKDLMKENLIKEGEKCSVFIYNGHGTFKSLRCDFRITNFIDVSTSKSYIEPDLRYHVYGELLIPELYNANLSFSMPGTSKDAIMDIASRLGLGFFFCDPDDTNDCQMWYCFADDDKSENSHIVKYIKDVTQHSWKNFNSFFDSWVDVRYGLTYLNINKMLGEDGMDENIDLTYLNNTLNQESAADKNLAEASASDKKNNPIPQLKLLSNITTDPSALTSFYVIDYQVVNNAGAITKQMGVNCCQNYVIDNTGVASVNADIEMKYSVPTNKTKLENGFYTLIEPGQNETYAEADNGDYTQQNTVVQGGKIADIQGDQDGNTISKTGNNNQSVGNVNKFFDAAYEHNRINNLLLQKKYVNMTLQGCNLGIMRGEKIPALIQDQQAQILGMNEDNKVTKLIVEDVSGWFIISSIKWIYDINSYMPGTLWTTEISLTRREWPIIGYKNVQSENTEPEIQANININEGSSVESSEDSEMTETNNEFNEEEEELTIGLRDFMIQLYQILKEQTGNRVKLIGARRWAVDQNGNKVEGNMFVSKNGLYKCVNAKDEVMYFQSVNSRHLYGEAIDILHDGGLDFNTLLTDYLLTNEAILKHMFNNGICCYIENTKDAGGNSVQHYHLGTDPDKQHTWWMNVKNANTNLSFNPDNYMTNNKRAAEITHEIVNEK